MIKEWLRKKKKKNKEKQKRKKMKKGENICIMYRYQDKRKL